MTDASFKARIPKTDLVRELLHGRAADIRPTARVGDVDHQGDLPMLPAVAGEPN